MKKIKPSLGDQSLRIVAIIITTLSVLFILFPFALTISNSMKDNSKIYDTPPKLIPDAAQSLDVVLDYTQLESPDSLEEMIQKDLVSIMFGAYTKLNRESIFEINFFGVKEGKTIFHSRAHQVELQLEKDYGIYEGTVINKDTLLHKDRAERTATKIGYEFNEDGLEKQVAPTISQLDIQEKIIGFTEEKLPIVGQLSISSLTKKNSLLLESFVHYMKLPQYVYGNNEKIAKYGFMTFVFNTVLVISFAIISQVLLCSICAFVISHLLSPKAARWTLLFFLGAMMVPFVSIMVPQLIMYREMGAYNNYAGLLLPFLYPFGFYIYLFKGFFDRIPGSFFEAARLDGASNFFLFTKICMPLSKPIISMIALQTFLGNWNDFFGLGWLPNVKIYGR
ncbi:carbohydrate ABC transporter permease [Jeotgalibaca sp. MA1X17-3]|uniref:carbohydrate ABC transporter permease n=1 Tax=Jeotgalibaca sp. MA1X17-3 TaxID=2908211 RepID=UPI001F2EE25E|nr:carbohydrate ABC transporter permease [Jeotgalibaca sp. MA1X17-3]UJF15629.1 carbohydrate ABC transporter permease [Jeotgalibaca sp. MA1X17-3]